MTKARATGGGSADIIILPKQLRMEWTDAMALDQRLSHSAFRVACAIGYHFGSRTGGTFVKHDTIARVLGISPRTVWTAIAELEAAGYLLVERKAHGTTTRALKSGATIEARVAGGKGVANSYLPAVDSSQLTATKRGANLAARCEVWWSNTSQNPAPYLAASCDPTLTSPSGKNPYARGRAREGAPLGASAAAPAAAWITSEDPRWSQLAERHAIEHGRPPRAYASRHQPDGLPGYSFPADWIDQATVAPTSSGGGAGGSPPSERRGRSANRVTPVPKREGGGSKVQTPQGSDRWGSHPHLCDEFGKRFLGTENG